MTALCLQSLSDKATEGLLGKQKDHREVSSSAEFLCVHIFNSPFLCYKKGTEKAGSSFSNYKA